MLYQAKVVNSRNRHEIILRTGDREHEIVIAPQESGFGSSANGGELLFLALATCYCNDIYREAARRGIEVSAIEVAVDGDFPGPGRPTEQIHYRARITSSAPEAELRDLLHHTDVIAEIQQTVRRATPVRLETYELVRPD